MKSKATRKIIILATVISVASSALFGFLGYSLTYGEYYRHFIAMKVRIAEICASAIDGDAHDAFTGGEAVDDPAYRRTLAFLNGVLAVDPAITFLYTLVPDGGSGFNYGVDAGISPHDTVWIESSDFALECFFDSDGVFIVRSEGLPHKKDFSVKKGASRYAVGIKRTGERVQLSVDGITLASISPGTGSGGRIGVRFADTELTQELYSAETVFAFGERLLSVSLSVSHRGESCSGPGTPYVNTEGNIERFRASFASGTAASDADPHDDTYGPMISCRAPVKNASGTVVALLVLDVSEREVRKVRFSIITALVLSFLPVAFVMVALINLMMQVFIVKPFRALIEGVSRVKFSDGDVLIDIHSHDEFESFADSFNAMIFSIRENRLRLEETVQERTSELENALTLLNEKSVKLEELAHTDGMTGLLNKHQLLVSLELESARVTRYGDLKKTTSSVVFIDLDNFKYINDTFGHGAGDMVLKRFASLISESARDCDITGRYGGDEFVILLPDTPPSGALVFVDRIRKKLEEARHFIPDLDELLDCQVSIPDDKLIGFSCGISAFKPHQTTAEVMKKADELLYEAKHQGKGRSMVDSDFSTASGATPL